MLSLDTKVNLAFFISLASIVWSIFVYKKGQRLERARIYDKVYGVGEWLLCYEYNNVIRQEYTSENKDLEKAVREHAKSHSTAQLFGTSFAIPKHLKTKEEVATFCDLVKEESNAFSKALNKEFFSNFGPKMQSPVFHLDNEEFAEKFNFVFKHIEDNLSYFSEKTKKAWSSARHTTVNDVKQQYLSLEEFNKNCCEPFYGESVDDPYLNVLMSIRFEYRSLTKTYSEHYDELQWGLTKMFNKLKNVT